MDAALVAQNLGIGQRFMSGNIIGKRPGWPNRATANIDGVILRLAYKKAGDICQLGNAKLI